jgi:hypothetical protein
MRKEKFMSRAVVIKPGLIMAHHQELSTTRVDAKSRREKESNAAQPVTLSKVFGIPQKLRQIYQSLSHSL